MGLDRLALKYKGAFRVQGAENVEFNIEHFVSWPHGFILYRTHGLSDWFTNNGIEWLNHSLHMRRALKLSLCTEMLVQGFQIQVFLSIAPAGRLYIA